jgi:formyltetrahydrofolate-dependent phosphoribosylglycinamide formyltransferase
LGALISGGGRTVLNILQQIRENRLDAEVCIVIASRYCKGVDLLRSEGIEVRIVPYKEMPNTEVYSEQIVSILGSADVDLVIQAGFLSLWLVPEQFVNRVMNIHPALLPAFGGKGMYGKRVHKAVLKRGNKISGCTVHFVNNEYDCGPIIIQRYVSVMENDTVDTLAARVFEQECIAYPQAIQLFSDNRLKIQGTIVRITQENPVE